MVDLTTPEEVTFRPPILDVLPAALRQDRSAARCICRSGAELSEPQREAHERVHEDWRLMRAAWCDANGYALFELLTAERARLSWS